MEYLTSMIRFKKYSLAVCALFLDLKAPKAADGCLPPNDLSFPAYSKDSAGLRKFEAEQLMTQFKEIMSPLVKKHLNKKLLLQLDWENDRVNATATRDDYNNPVIIFLGGMVRHPNMNRDAFISILCHELGHHLGGAPRKPRGRSGRKSWASAEGQADYFAAVKCLPLFFDNVKESRNLSAYYESNELKRADDVCGANTTCSKITLAGLSMARLFASIKGYYQMPSLNLRDQTVVWETRYGHAVPQCRLDTIVSGAQCNVSPLDPFHPDNPELGACIHKAEESHSPGARPRCWYKPVQKK